MLRALCRPAGLLLVAGGLLSGCGSLPERQAADGPPARSVDLSRIPDAVPRPEPRSKYGNPPSYVVNGRRYYVLPDSKGYVERGIASWYGTKFHGRRAAIGEPYDMFSMSAAHKTLPLPTYVEVTNLENGRKVIVRVNDRGPFKANRLIDLSYAAAAKLGIVESGTGLVEVRALDPQAPRQKQDSAPSTESGIQVNAQPPPEPAHLQKLPPPGAARPPNQAAAATGNSPPRIFLQVGAFSERRNAERLSRWLLKRLQEPHRARIRIVHHGSAAAPLYRVHIGPLDGVEAADRMTRTLEPLGLGEPHLVIQ